MTGTLYLCATPIGNLEDITLRVLRTLKEVDLIAAEDTRNSIRLLNHFAIRTKMTSYHEYNKIEKAAALVEKMRQGMNIALITDAGDLRSGRRTGQTVYGRRCSGDIPSGSLRLRDGSDSVGDADTAVCFRGISSL